MQSSLIKCLVVAAPVAVAGGAYLGSELGQETTSSARDFLLKDKSVSLLSDNSSVSDFTSALEKWKARGSDRSRSNIEDLYESAERMSNQDMFLKMKKDHLDICNSWLSMGVENEKDSDFLDVKALCSKTVS